QTAPTVSRFYAPIRPADPTISWDLGLAGVLVGLLATLLAAYWPARQAARVDPVEPLRRATKKLSFANVPHRKLVVFSALLLAPAAIAARYATVVTSFGAMFLVLASGLLCVPTMVLALRRIFAGPVEKLFGLPGRVAIDNAERSLGRTALTV